MFCKNCGTTMEATERYCPNCGAMVTNDAPTPHYEATYTDDKSSRHIVPIVSLMVVAVLVLVAAIVCLLVLMGDSSEKDDTQSEPTPTTMIVTTTTTMTTTMPTTTMPTAAPTTAPTAAPVVVTEYVYVLPPTTVPTAAPTRPPVVYYDNSYIIPGSSSRYLSQSEVEGMSTNELIYAINEIYARNGYIFNDAEFANYFATKSWYTPRVPASQFSTSRFNSYEQYNVDLLKAERESRR